MGLEDVYFLEEDGGDGEDDEEEGLPDALVFLHRQKGTFFDELVTSLCAGTGLPEALSLIPNSILITTTF